MANQKQIGNEYEGKVALLLQKKGYWCHIFAYNHNGQPCDIIAINGKKTILIDVKHCVSNRFYLTRVEPNQKNCFKYARKCGVKYTGFAIWFEKDQCFKWLSYDEKSINVNSFHTDELQRLEDFLCS